MKETRISIPELALVAGTRAALGAGLGLLLANRLSEEQRKAAGWALVLVGALSTVPLALEVLGKERRALSTEGSEQIGSASKSEANEVGQGAYSRALLE